MYESYLVLFLVLLITSFPFAIATSITLRTLFNASKLSSWIISLLAVIGFSGAILVIVWYLVVLRGEGLTNPIPAVIYSQNNIVPILSFVVAGGLAAIFIFINRKVVTKVMLSVLGIFFTLCWGFLIWACLMIFNPCDNEPSMAFHYFHDHLKSLCVNRDDKSECPKDESELRAFNPIVWDRLQQCSEARYSFDQQSETFLFSVKDTGYPLSTTTDQGDGFTLGE